MRIRIRSRFASSSRIIPSTQTHLYGYNQFVRRPFHGGGFSPQHEGKSNRASAAAAHCSLALAMGSRGAAARKRLIGGNTQSRSLAGITYNSNHNGAPACTPSNRQLYFAPGKLAWDTLATVHRARAHCLLCPLCCERLPLGGRQSQCTSQPRRVKGFRSGMSKRAVWYVQRSWH